MTTSRIEALQALRSCASSLETFAQPFLHRAWPKTHGPESGSRSALIVVARAFSCPPVPPHHVRGDVRLLRVITEGSFVITTVAAGAETTADTTVAAAAPHTHTHTQRSSVYFLCAFVCACHDVRGASHEPPRDTAPCPPACLTACTVLVRARVRAREGLGSVWSGRTAVYPPYPSIPLAGHGYAPSRGGSRRPSTDNDG